MTASTARNLNRVGRPLSSKEKAEYTVQGYAVTRKRWRAYTNAVWNHCVRAKVPYLIVTARNRYCSVQLEMDTVAFPISLPDDAPLAEWAEEALKGVPGRRDWLDIQVSDDSFYLEKVLIDDGIRLAQRIAAYLREHGYGANTGVFKVIDLEAERRKRLPGPDPNGAD